MRSPRAVLVLMCANYGSAQQPSKCPISGLPTNIRVAHSSRLRLKWGREILRLTLRGG